MNDQQFLDDVWTGLTQPQKTLPCKYFYDEAGSHLFEQITQQDEYYLTRTEVDLLKQIRQDIARYIGKHAQIIEPGSGASIKIKLVIGALDTPVSYVPFEISSEILGRSSQEIAQTFPDIRVQPISGDFTQYVSIPHPVHTACDKQTPTKVIFFPGSTIGNFSPSDAKALLEHFANLLDYNGMIIIGVDRVKSEDILKRAYDDECGVTDAFNKNILHRINKTFNANIDVEGSFRHHAFYNQNLQRIEMHLVSLCDQQIDIAGKVFNLHQGESIHTENSYKYRPDDFVELSQAAGFEHLKYWTDDAQHFSIHCLSMG